MKPVFLSLYLQLIVLLNKLRGRGNKLKTYLEDIINISRGGYFLFSFSFSFHNLLSVNNEVKSNIIYDGGGFGDGCIYNERVVF